MHPSERSSDAERWLVTLATAILLVGITTCLRPECFPSESERAIRQIITAVELRRPESLQLANEFLRSFEASPFSIALAAEAAAVSFEHESAIQLFRQLPEDAGRWEFQRNLGIARRCEILGKLSDEERLLRRALELNPHSLEANERMGNLLQVAGRAWESAPYFYTQIRCGKCRGDELLGMATTERFFREDQRLEKSGLDAIPPEPMAKLAMARRITYENQPAKAESLLREVIEAAPDLGEAQGRLGRIIFDRGDPVEFLQWRGNLSERARNHPEVWYSQGLQARRLGQVEGAVRCFLEALNLSPNHLASNIQISACLKQLGRDEIAKAFVRRGELLESLETIMNVLRNDSDPEHMQKAIAILGDLGRYWEAAGWTYALTQLEVPQQGLRQEFQRCRQLAMLNDLPTGSQDLPASRLRRSDFAEPRWALPTATDNRVSPFAEQTSIPWKFQDEADDVGIRFQYVEGTTESTRLLHIFNVVGGGLAAVDYDVDGWCDLHLAQANNWRDKSIQPDYPDRLFRNRLGERFDDVTRFAGVGDLGFSHGVAAGDFDQDGFPDLYIGNLGPNCLYRNNGDGTFDDLTDAANVAGNEWTTSSAFADFNGDGLPDLYVANYSVLEETAQKECKNKANQSVACTPNVLTAEYHRFYLNQGDGSFQDFTVDSGMHVANGRGLGLIAWDFDGNGRLGLFVANDTCPNFLFTNAGNDVRGIPQFREEGIVRGVAVDTDGNAKASMGVAAGDANGDGRLDLFITTFFGESNTFYSQRSDGSFDDLTRTLNLRESGFWMLGFGSQFGDFDGDGWDDIVVTNGHVDQKSRNGDPDRMRPQLFRNLAGRKFAEIPPRELPAFFGKTYLGRGLATLDWNRDGRIDFGVSNLHGPFALVTNHTESTRRPLIVRLAGRSGSRQPVGATVRVRIQGTNSIRLLTGGDGYLVSNEHRFAFWIPEDQQESEVEVRWPGGKIESWNGIRAGQELLLIEGKPQPVLLRDLLDSKTESDP